MAVMQNEMSPGQSQRIQVEMDADRSVKIRVESHDECLGWYTSAALSLPMHQLALLEQAVEDLRKNMSPEGSLGDKIIPFPTQAAA
jgi:hypothetical protein